MTKFRESFTRIKELSDRRRLPRLGKIRLGVKMVSKKGKEYPKEVNHFVVPPEVEKVYGDKPTELDVMFPLNDIDTVFPQAYKFYGSSQGLKCIGNGESAMRLDEKTQRMKEHTCPCAFLEQGACQRRAHLMIMLPRVSMGGVYQIDLGSFHSIVDVNSGLDYIQALIGRFAMIPLTLKRVPRETHSGGQKTIHYPLQINLANADVEMINALRDDNRRVLTAASRLALAPPEDGNPRMDEGATVVIEEEDPAVPSKSNNGVNADASQTVKLTSQPSDSPNFTPESETSQSQPQIQEQVPVHKQAQAASLQEQSPKSTTDPAILPAQQTAIIKLATKAGIKEEIVLQTIRSMSQGAAADTIVSLQRGDTTLFRHQAA